ncbi:MAG: EAL domain-containing protein [Actinomycetota bacterium]|jgi:EAL domain-containing protein (putative c-di-GMP-specific phosphodiesterase class I)|nr:EAL domain-containing protein [Actinomycetota bacterium]
MTAVDAASVGVTRALTSLPHLRALRSRIEAVLVAPAGIMPVFQPIVMLATGKIVGYEALARFPQLPLQTPDLWFAQAHACGLGEPLEAKAVRAALAVPRPPDRYVSVNLSPSAVTSFEVLEALPTDLRGVVVEITEQQAVTDERALEAALIALRGAGARIAIDDTGSGYAGLQRMMRTRSDFLKIDRTLIEGVHGDAVKVALIESLVSFARRTGTDVCAEGVETLDELTMLADLDVAYAQGYALARPGPPWAQIQVAAATACLGANSAAMQFRRERRAPIEDADQHLEDLAGVLPDITSLDDLALMADDLATMLGADHVLLSSFDQQADTLESIDVAAWRCTGERYQLADYPATAAAFRRREALQVLSDDSDADAAETAVLRAMGYRSMLLVPMQARGHPVGLLEFYSRTRRLWTRAELHRARIVAGQVSLVIAGLVPRS